MPASCAHEQLLLSYIGSREQFPGPDLRYSYMATIALCINI